MRIGFTPIVLVLVFAVLFYGCSGATTAPEKTSDTVPSTGTCNQYLDGDKETSKYIECITSIALQKKDSSVCDVLKNNGWCLQKVAIATNDLDYCKNKFPSRSSKQDIDNFNDCVIMIGREFPDLEKGKEMCSQATFNEIKCICLKSVYNNEISPSKCSELKTRFSCPNEITQSGSWGKGGTINLIDECYFGFSTSNNYSYTYKETCGMIEDQTSKLKCMAGRIPREALATKDPALCDLIKDNPYLAYMNSVTYEDCKKYASAG